MNPESRLQHRSREEQEQQAESSAETTASTRLGSDSAGSAEELLRRDRAATPVPDPVTRRLAETLRHEGAPAAPPQPTRWWRHLLGR